MKKIIINGPIISSDEKWIYDYFDEESTCAKDVSEALPLNGEAIEVTINSFGGYVDQGAEIYTILKSYNGDVTINVVAAYSAASVIAMAGDTVRMSPVGRMMIHNAASSNFGDYRDMDKQSEVLKNANDALSNAYVNKTGLTKEEVLQMMDSETWFTAEKAVSKGFADEIMFESKDEMRLVANAAGLLSNNIIKKMKIMKQDEMNKPKNESPEEKVNPMARFFFNTKN